MINQGIYHQVAGTPQNLYIYIIYNIYIYQVYIYVYIYVVCTSSSLLIIISTFIYNENKEIRHPVVTVLEHTRYLVCRIAPSH